VATDPAAELARLEGGLDAGSLGLALVGCLGPLLEAGHEQRLRRLVARVDSELLQGRSCVPANLWLVARLYQRLAAHSGSDADLDRAERLCATALQEGLNEGDQPWVTEARRELALIYLQRARTSPAEYSQAIPLLEDVLAGMGGDGQHDQRASVCMALGDAYAGLPEHGADHLELARDYYEQALRGFQTCERERDAAAVHERLADTWTRLEAHVGEGAATQALDHYRQARDSYRDAGDDAGDWRCSLGIADLMARRCRAGRVPLDEAVAACEAAATRLAAAGRQAEAGHALVLLGSVWAAGATTDDGARLVAAVDSFTAALRHFDAAGQPPAVQPDRATALAGLAEVFLAAGAASEPADVQKAIDLLQQACRIHADASASEAYRSTNDALRRARSLLASLGAARQTPRVQAGRCGSSAGHPAAPAVPPR